MHLCLAFCKANVSVRSTENVIIQDDFRRLIRDEMKSQGLTQIQLADRMGVKQATVSQYLSGKISPGPDVIEKFCKALGKVPRLRFEEATSSA